MPVPVPPMLLGERQPEQVVLGERLADVPRVLRLGVDLGGARGNLAPHEVADRVAEVLELLGKAVGVGARRRRGRHGPDDTRYSDYLAVTGVAAAAATYPRRMRQELRPLFDRVVIKELDPDRIRRSGLVVPPGTNEPPPQHGIVLAIGQGLDWWESVGVKMPVKPGDHVVFPASAGVWVEVEEERLLVCRVGELLGVLDPVADPAPV